MIEHTKILIGPPLCISSVNRFSTQSDILPKKENTFTTYMLPRYLVLSTISLIYNPKGEVLHNSYTSSIHPIHPHRANYITDLIGVPKSFKVRRETRSGPRRERSAGYPEPYVSDPRNSVHSRRDQLSPRVVHRAVGWDGIG